jgi:hypothetical protein
MKWAHRLLGLLLVLLAGGALTRILVPSIQGGTEWAGFVADFANNRHGVMAFGLVLIVLVVAYIATSFGRGPGSQYLSYESKQGNISISLKALQDFLGHLKSEFPSILTLTPKVSARDEALDVILHVRIKAGAPIPEISRMLQERARLTIQEKVGISDIRDVEVKVEEIVRDKDSLASRTVESVPKPPPAGEPP